jgi:predicted lipid-binding transport protein (Tim44 family)
MLAPVAALARAGGGQEYGGGGFGGGDGSGGFGGIPLWPLLFFGHGSGVGTLILLLVVYYLYRRYATGFGTMTVNPAGEAWNTAFEDQPSAAGPTIVVGGAPVADAQVVAAGIAAIKQRDPNFDEAAFLDRAQTAFFKVQQAWQARNQDLARDVMSAALYERHKMQTDQLIARHRVDVLENIVIGHATIVAVTPGTAYDSIVVAFSASMSDYTIDEQTKQIVEGSREPQTFTELWTFIRRADAKTNVAQTQLAATCPSCGAPLELVDGKCSYCGAYVRTSSSDWVVDQIEQTT